MPEIKVVNMAGAEVGTRAPLVDYTTEDIEPGEVFDRRDTNA